MPADLKFPRNFLWGTATSSYQVEGSIKNDWSEWETSKARLAYLKKKEFDKKEFINKKACSHYRLYNRDFDLAKKLGNNSHRFSIEWARIQPEKGKFNEKEIGHYRGVVDALKKRRLEPFLTAYHFTLPLWLSGQGGWLNKESVEYFESYISRLASEFKDVRFWVTINEPMVLAYKCYWQGDWPPCRKKKLNALKAIKNLASAHKAAYKILKEQHGLQVGIAKSMICFRGMLRFSDYFYNHSFLDSIIGYQDFIGLNYYTRKRVPRERGISRSDMGWAIFPRGIYLMLKRLALYGVPVYITENGIADSTDKKRGKYIVNHLEEVHKAISEGIDVRGYFYWSLIDNFEWDWGFTKRFGLVSINYKSMARIPQESFNVYKQICRSNRISKELQERFL